MIKRHSLLALSGRCCHCFQPSVFAVVVVLVAAVLAGIFTNVEFAAVAVFSVVDIN